MKTRTKDRKTFKCFMLIFILFMLYSNIMILKNEKQNDFMMIYYYQELYNPVYQTDTSYDKTFGLVPNITENFYGFTGDDNGFIPNNYDSVYIYYKYDRLFHPFKSKEYDLYMILFNDENIKYKIINKDIENYLHN